MVFPIRASLAALFLLVLHVSAVAVWPQPAQMTAGSDARPLQASSFSIKLPPAWEHDEDLQLAVKRALNRIYSHPIAPSTTDYGAGQAAKARKASNLKALNVQVSCKEAHGKRSKQTPWQAKAASSGLQVLSAAKLEEQDEQYTLYVPSDDGPATLQANNALGALRGLATFSQLVYTSRDGDKTTFVDGLPLNITDKAAFPYRGIMLDTARNYLAPTAIKRQLDAMELLKLNQFHWHITDTASWPLGLRTKGMNVMAARGAYPDGGVYDEAVVRDIVRYAGQRGVNVVMEIDQPGHMYAGVKDYPGELVTCGADDPTAPANEPPSGQLDIRKPAAAQLMKDVFSELTAWLPGAYVSTGNDEVETGCYGLQKGDYNGTDALLAPFVDEVHSHLVKLGKTPMVWEEAALNYPETAKHLKNGTIVEAWTTSANVEALLKSNTALRLVHAPSDFFYLDCGMGTFLGNSVDGTSWCPYVSWMKQYSFDPLNGTRAVPDGAKRIMGGESALWAEQVDEANLESLLWPRAASGAEVFWTGASFALNDESHIERNLTFALPRLHEARARLRAMGIRAAPLQPAWCATRPGACDAPA